MSNNNRRENVAVDRISSLPDAIIHHIFSLLDMEDVVHTSTLSNRWRYVWQSTPVLNFNIDEWLWNYEFGSEMWRERRNDFMEFVSKVLILGNNSNIEKFHLFSDEECFEETHLCEWVKAAVQRSVEHVCLQFVVDRPLNFPNYLFTENIRVLELFISSCLPEARLPSSLCTAPYLKILKLRVVILPEGDANGELILSCPLLETLQIFRCDAKHLKTLTICTPLLKSLDLELFLHSDAYTSCVVKISTPKLETLELQTTFWSQGYTLVDYAMENLSSLVSAKFDIRDTDITPLYDVYPHLVIPYLECLSKLFSGIHNVRSLKLSVYTIQVLADFLELLERLSNLFHNLKYVMLMDRWAPSVYAMLNFLERFPCIDTLVWQRDFGECSMETHEEEEWVENLPLENIFSCLETFEIHNFKGKEIELKFLEFVLQRATLLKAVIIRTSKSFLSDAKLAEVTDMLSSTPRASSSASVSFQFEKLEDD